jgi:hypothetical protein
VDELACPQCGSTNPADGNFCSACGASLAEADAHTQSHVAMVGPPPEGEVAMLVVVRGANAGSRFALTEPVTTIGRHPDSDVFLDDVTVSRRHAEVRRGMVGLEIADAGSLNGTYVNGERIEVVPLSEGDQLQIGKYRLVVVVGGAGGTD